jgi:hypothetical protein
MTWRLLPCLVWFCVKRCERACPASAGRTAAPALRAAGGDERKEFSFSDFVENDGDGTANGLFAIPSRWATAPPLRDELQQFIVRRRQIISRGQSGAVSITDGKKWRRNLTTIPARADERL